VSGAAYLIGRNEADLMSTITGGNFLFANQLVDGELIENRNFIHSTFANVSFKGVRLRYGVFRNCVFVDCYFREASLYACQFIACKFIDCRFPHTSITTCGWAYTEFRGCYIAFDQMRLSLPGEPNLRQALSSNLGREAQRAGEERDASSYRLDAVAARKTDLWGAVKNDSTYYQDKYRGSKRWFAAALPCSPLRATTNGTRMARRDTNGIVG